MFTIFLIIYKCDSYSFGYVIHSKKRSSKNEISGVVMVAIRRGARGYVGGGASPAGRPALICSYLKYFTVNRFVFFFYVFLSPRFQLLCAL